MAGRDHPGKSTISTMRALFLTLLVTTLAQAQPGTAKIDPTPTPLEIVQQEQHLWRTFAEGNFSTVRALFTPDFIQVDSHIAALDTLLVTFQQCHLTTYELRDLQVRILSPTSALTAYHVVNTFDCGTEDKPDLRHFDNNSTTTWVRRGSKWFVQAHTETPARP